MSERNAARAELRFNALVKADELAADLEKHTDPTVRDRARLLRSELARLGQSLNEEQREHDGTNAHSLRSLASFTSAARRAGFVK